MGNVVAENVFPYSQVAFSSAARTATPTAFSAYNKGNFNAVQVLISTTAAGTSPSTTYVIATWDSKASAWIDLLTSAAVTGTANGNLVLQIGGVGQNVANVTDVRHPGKRIRVSPTHGNSTTHTYSVTLNWIRA